MKQNNSISELNSEMVAKWLIECSDEEFAETFVRHYRLHLGYTDEIKREDMLNADIGKIVGYIRDSLNEIIPADSEMCQGAWWKRIQPPRMKVKYIGFGGYTEYPCYEDENGKIYFDTNDGRGELQLYSGAYRHPEDEDDYIYGEPHIKITEPVECDKPFVRHPRERDYMMLSRLQMDCNYFLGNGNGYEGHLYYKSVEVHCDEMEKLWNSFAAEDKPEWLTMEQIKENRKKMLMARRKKIVSNQIQ